MGVLWLNAAETWIDVKNSVADKVTLNFSPLRGGPFRFLKSLFRNLLDRFKSEPEVPQIDTHWMSESGIIDIYLFLGPKPADVFRQYSDFFGVTNLPLVSLDCFFVLFPRVVPFPFYSTSLWLTTSVGGTTTIWTT